MLVTWQADPSDPISLRLSSGNENAVAQPWNASSVPTGLPWNWAFGSSSRRKLPSSAALTLSSVQAFVWLIVWHTSIILDTKKPGAPNWIRIPGLPYWFVGRYSRKYLRICWFKLVCHQNLFRNKVFTSKCSNQRKRSKQPIYLKSQRNVCNNSFDFFFFFFSFSFNSDTVSWIFLVIVRSFFFAFSFCFGFICGLSSW